MYNERYIGIRVRERRKKLKLTQKELAAKLDGTILLDSATHSQISQWESGKKIPETVALIRLCNALDCDMDYLLGQIPVARRDTADVIEVTGLTEKSVAVFDSLSRDDMEILNEILVSPHFLELISAISDGVESPRIKSNLIIEFMKERLSGNENKGLVDVVRKYVAEDIGTIFKFKATDAAGKMYDEVSDTLCGRREEHG